MNEFFIPRKNVARFELQPDFPNEDLTSNNTDMLKYKLAGESGLDNYAEALARKQRIIYAVATQALDSLRIAARFDPKGLYAFSHGFAGFESMTDMVHPQDKLAYPLDIAVERVSNDVIDSRSSTEIEFEAIMHKNDEPELPKGMTTDGVRPRYVKHGEDTVDLPPTHADFLIKKHAAKLEYFRKHRVRTDTPAKMARHYMKVMRTYPNMVDVMTTIGESRAESMPELYSRLAGMAFAHSLQTRD